MSSRRLEGFLRVGAPAASWGASARSAGRGPRGHRGRVRKGGGGLVPEWRGDVRAARCVAVVEVCATWRAGGQERAAARLGTPGQAATTLREAARQARQPRPGFPVAEYLDVVENQGNGLAHGGQRCRQPGHDIGCDGDARRGQSVEHPRVDQLDAIKRGGDVGQQDRRIVVSVVDRDPAHLAPHCARPTGPATSSCRSWGSDDADAWRGLRPKQPIHQRGPEHNPGRAGGGRNFDSTSGNDGLGAEPSSGAWCERAILVQPLYNGITHCGRCATACRCDTLTRARPRVVAPGQVGGGCPLPHPSPPMTAYGSGQGMMLGTGVVRARILEERA